MVVNSILQRLNKGEKVFEIEGLYDSPSKAFFIFNLYKVISRPLVIITSRQDSAEELFADINFFLSHQSTIRNSQSEITPYYFPPWELLPYEPISPHSDILGERLKTLSSLIESRSDFILLIPVESLIQKIPPKEILRDAVL